MGREKSIFVTIMFIGIALLIIPTSVIFMEKSNELIREFNNISNHWKISRLKDCQNANEENNSNDLLICSQYKHKIWTQIFSLRSHPLIKESNENETSNNVLVKTYFKEEDLIQELESQLRGYPESWVGISISLMVFAILQIFVNLVILIILIKMPEEIVETWKGFKIDLAQSWSFATVFFILFIIGMVRGVHIANSACPGLAIDSEFGNQIDSDNNCNSIKTIGTLLMGTVGLNTSILIAGFLGLHGRVFLSYTIVCFQCCTGYYRYE